MRSGILSDSAIARYFRSRLPTDYYIRKSDVEQPRAFLISEDAKILDSVALAERLERLGGPARLSGAEIAQAQIHAVLMAELGNHTDVMTVLRAFAKAGGVALRDDSFPTRYFVIIHNIWLLHVRSVEGMVQSANEMGIKSTRVI